jgi:hypothetical protein
MQVVFLGYWLELSGGVDAVVKIIGIVIGTPLSSFIIFSTVKHCEEGSVVSNTDDDDQLTPPIMSHMVHAGTGCSHSEQDQGCKESRQPTPS